MTFSMGKDETKHRSAEPRWVASARLDRRPHRMQIDLLLAESEGDAALAGSDLGKSQHASVEEHALLDVGYSEHEMIETIGKRRSQRVYSAGAAAGACRALRRQEQGSSRSHCGNGAKQREQPVESAGHIVKSAFHLHAEPTDAKRENKFEAESEPRHLLGA